MNRPSEIINNRRKADIRGEFRVEETLLNLEKAFSLMQTKISGTAEINVGFIDMDNAILVTAYSCISQRKDKNMCRQDCRARYPFSVIHHLLQWSIDRENALV